MTVCLVSQVYEMMNAADKAKFEQAYSAAYSPAKDVLAEIYDEVRRWVMPDIRIISSRLHT